MENQFYIQTLIGLKSKGDTKIQEIF